MLMLGCPNALILECLCLLRSWGQGGSVPFVIINSRVSSSSLLGQIESTRRHAWARGGRCHGLVLLQFVHEDGNDDQKDCSEHEEKAKNDVVLVSPSLLLLGDLLDDD